MYYLHPLSQPSLPHRRLASNRYFRQRQAAYRRATTTPHGSLFHPHLHQSDIIVTNARHFEALTHALEAIHRVQEGLNSSLSGDFISQDLRECIFHLSDIVGEVTTDQVLQNIFRYFCIGK